MAKIVPDMPKRRRATGRSLLLPGGNRLSGRLGGRLQVRSNIVPRWTVSSCPSSGVWSDVCWSPELGIFAAVGESSACMTSRDGVNWINRTVPSGTWRSVCWSSDLRCFVAVASATAQGCISYDGILWTAVTLGAGLWRGVRYSHEQRQFVAMNFDNDATCAATSPDGINWTQRTTPAGAYIFPAWSPELKIWVASCDRSGGGDAVWSLDGITWTAATTGFLAGETCMGVEWSSKLGLFVATCFGTANRVYTSRDGKRWTRIDTLETISAGAGLVWCPGPDVFLIGGQTGSTTNSGFSYDGVIWHNMQRPGTMQQRAICYSPKLKMAVAPSYGAATVSQCRF